MSRKTVERLIALALATLALCLILGAARTYHSRPPTTQRLLLHFNSGYAAAEPAAQSLSVAPVPGRAQIDPQSLPVAAPDVAPLRQKVAPTPAALLKRKPAKRPPGRRRASGSPERLTIRPPAHPPRSPAIDKTPKAESIPRPSPAPRPVLESRDVPPSEPVSDPAQLEDALDTDTIMEWMQLRPAALPPGIRRHMEYSDHSITAVASLQHEGVEYELYLMAKRGVREMHVVLVHKTQSFYLIDRSFKREGRSFRVGTVRRSRNVITGVVSEERPAGSPEALQFYQVFLAWWDAEQLKR